MIKFVQTEINDLRLGETEISAAYVGEMLAWTRNLFYPTIVSGLYHDANGVVTTTTGRQNRFLQVEGGIFVQSRKRLLFTWDGLITGAVKPAFRVSFFTADGAFIRPRTLVQLADTDPKEWSCTVPENAARMYVEVDDVSNTAHVGFENFRITRA